MSKNKIQSAWSFVEKFYPNYSNCDLIARANDLALIVDGTELEKDSAAENIFINECDENVVVAIEKYYETHFIIYERAILGFMETFTDWQETHYEIVAGFHSFVNSPVLEKIESNKGRGGMYEFAKELTNKFELKHNKRNWDGDFFDEMEMFLNKELNVVKS